MGLRLAAVLQALRRLLYGVFIGPVGRRAPCGYGGVEQGVGQFLQRKLHPSLLLEKPGLRRKQLHGQACRFPIGGCDQRLQGRRKNGVYPAAPLEPDGQAMFQRKSMTMAEKCQILHHALGQIIASRPGEAQGIVDAGRVCLSEQQLPGHMGAHPADLSDDFIAEERIAVIGQQHAQHRACSPQHDVAPRQFRGQDIFDRCLRPMVHPGFGHPPALAGHS